MFNSEIVSWIAVLFLILHNFFLKRMKLTQILILCSLFILDIIFGFLFMNEIIHLKINHYVRLVFLVYFSEYTRNLIRNYIDLILKIKKLLILFLTVMSFLGMFIFVLYFDINDDTKESYFTKLNFSTILQSIISFISIYFNENGLNLFNHTMHKQSIFIFFLIPMFYVTIFLFEAFMIGIISYFY